MNTLNDTITKNINSTVFPNLAKRLSDLGNILDSVGKGQDNDNDDDDSIEAFEAEIISQVNIPDKALAELSKPLYEKVVCDIPFLVLDPNKKLVAKQSLSKLRSADYYLVILLQYNLFQ